MDPNTSKSDFLDRFKEDEKEIAEISRIEESELLQSPRFKRLQSSSPPRSGSSSPSKSSGSNENNTSLDVIPKLEYKKSNPLLRTPTKSKNNKHPLQPLNTRSHSSRFLPSSPTKIQNAKFSEMKVSLTPAQRLEKRPGRLLNTNDILSQYDFKETVGRGAFANVYRAINKHTGAEVAVKEIVIEDDDNILELMSEIDLLKVLKHQNIVKYHGFLRNEKKLFIFLEYCSGGSLRNLYKKSGPLTEGQVAKYMNQVLEGLIYLHEQGVVHRDVKAANILLTSKGDIKLTDFGVSTKETNKTIKTYSIAGTPNWMAPEIISMDGTSTASDIWSLGATIVELLAGEPLYAHLNEMAALHAIVTDDYPPIPQFITTLCKDFLLKCFEKQPNNRITAKELLNHSWLKQTGKSIKPVDSIILRHRKSNSRSSIENDFNSIKRHNSMKFLPLGVSTFKHTTIEITDIIENELVDEFHELDIKKSRFERSANVFEPMSSIQWISEWEQMKEAIISDPFDVDIVYDAIKKFQENKDEAIESVDTFFMYQILTWINPEDVDSATIGPLVELLCCIIEASDKMAKAYVDLGGMPIISKLCTIEQPLKLKSCALSIQSLALNMDSRSLAIYVQSGCLQRDLKLLEEDCKGELSAVRFIIETIYRSFKEKVVPREALQAITLSFPNFLDWIAVLLLHFVNLSDSVFVDKTVSIICCSRSSSLLHPKPIFINSICKVHQKLSKSQQIRILKFMKSLSMSELSEGSNFVKFLVKTMRRASSSKQLDSEILNLTCSIMFNICHLDQERQTELLSHDCLPILQRIMNSTLPCNEFIIPLLCELPFNDHLTSLITKPGSGILENYLELLLDPVWQANALDALVSLQDRVGGDQIPHILLTKDCQFLIRGFLIEDSLNQELFLSRLIRFLGLHTKSMSINKIRLLLFNNDNVVDAILQRIKKYKSDLVVQVNLFKLLKVLSMSNFSYPNHERVVLFLKNLKKSNVLLIDQLVCEILASENNKENSMMKPPSFNAPSVLSHTVI